MSKTDAITLKRKILGILMRNARAGAGFSLTETAELLALAPSTLKDYESGQQEPDLPLLENLARLCKVPVSYFWSDTSLPSPDRNYEYPQAITLRRKVVGLLLNKARTDANYPPEKIAEYLGNSAEQIAHYEQGQIGIPFSQLNALTELLNVDLDYFLDGANGAEAALVEQREDAAQREPAATGSGSYSVPADLPDDVAAFLQDPTNLLYIKLAMRLQSLSTETLRALAEGILDITY
jgi:transcriptional regulator with XRE-family HTH domain